MQSKLNPTAIRKYLRHAFNELLPPPTKNEIYVSGWVASGSTFIYQVLSEFNLKVTKVHGLPNWNSGDLTFYPIRDPRDVILSTAFRKYQLDVERGDVTETIREAIHHLYYKLKIVDDYYKAINRQNLIFLRYETFFKGFEKKLIAFLADQVGCSLIDDDVDIIMQKFSLNSNKERMRNQKGFENWDNRTKIHGNHISNDGKIGGWKELFNYELASDVNALFGNFIIDLQYEKDASWVANFRNRKR